MSRHWERIVLVLSVCVPIPILAASGLTIPLPGLVERIAASLVPFADAATLESNQALASGTRGSIVLLAQDGQPATSSSISAGSRSHRGATRTEAPAGSEAATLQKEGSGTDRARPNSSPTIGEPPDHGDGPAGPDIGPSDDPKEPGTDPGKGPTGQPETPPRDDQNEEKPIDEPDLPPVNEPDLPPGNVPDLPPIDSPDLPPVDSPDLPPVDSPDLPPVHVPGLPPIDPPDLPPINVPDLPPADVPRPPPIGLPGLGG